MSEEVRHNNIKFLLNGRIIHKDVNVFIFLKHFGFLNLFFTQNFRGMFSRVVSFFLFSIGLYIHICARRE